MPAKGSRSSKSNLKTDDMERWRVSLRMTLDREHRRFQKANDVDYFEDLLKSKLTNKSQEEQQSQGLSLNLARLDDGAFIKLANFLKNFIGQCPSIEELNKLHKVQRDLLVDLRQEIYRKAADQGCAEPYCLFCGTVFQQQQQIANNPCNAQLQQNNYTPNVANSVSTPPPSAAPTPDEGQLNHSLIHLQSQFSTSFTRQSRSSGSVTPPLTAGAVAAMRLRQNQEAQRALEEARNATSQANASPIGLVNLNQQPNDLDDDERSEVASVREMVVQVNRIISSPSRRKRLSSSSTPSSGSSSDLVMDVSADESTSQMSERGTPTYFRIKKMREEQEKPKPGPSRMKRGGPKRKDSRGASFPNNSGR